MSLLKVRIFYSNRRQPCEPPHTHNTVLLPCVCVSCKRELEKDWGKGRCGCCVNSILSVSESSRLISREGVMVIYLCFGFTLLILDAVVGSRVKCHQRTFIENTQH